MAPPYPAADQVQIAPPRQSARLSYPNRPGPAILPIKVAVRHKCAKSDLNIFTGMKRSKTHCARAVTA